MSILYTVVGSAIGAVVSRSVLTIIDHLDRMDPSIDKQMWWGLMISILVLTVLLIIVLVRQEKANGEKSDKGTTETFIPTMI